MIENRETRTNVGLYETGKLHLALRTLRAYLVGYLDLGCNYHLARLLHGYEQPTATALLSTNNVLRVSNKITGLLKIAATGMDFTAGAYDPSVLEITVSSCLFISSILSSSPFRKRI
jgi:hypothetical protein